MTVQELITQLQQFDPNMEVRVQGTDPTDWTYQNEIEKIKVSESNWEEEQEAIEWDEDGDETDWGGKKIVVIDGGVF